jgi:hypothetical protein
VSLPSDIIQLFGTGSVPVVVAGSVLGVFEVGERLASQRAKDALSGWLVSFDVQKAKALPDGTQEIFERIFGKRHFTLKCFVRSAAFSLGAMAFIGILLFLISPHKIFEIVRWIFTFGGEGEYNIWLPLTIWLPWSILIDYVSLLKTRVILGILTRKRRVNQLAAIAIVGIDYIVYRILFFLGILSTMVVLAVALLGISAVNQPRMIMSKFTEILSAEGVGQSPLPFFPTSTDLGTILYWAGFVPSIWMWLYVLALFVTRALLRSERIVAWLRWFFDVEKAPFRSIGAVAASLAFIVSVAILLVSAEASRISTAT